jgi:hypothetical protein
MHWVPGRRVAGYGVASGRAGPEHSPCPAGTIAPQAPFFRAAGADLSGHFRGTLPEGARVEVGFP